MDYFSKSFLIVSGIFFIGLIFLWFYRVFAVMQVFLKAAKEILEGTRLVKGRFLPVYCEEEVKGQYKGREVTAGVVYSGLNGEFMPLPHICMRLKDASAYNLNRLPHDTTVKKNILIYQEKVSYTWGVFDKSYPEIFTKRNLTIALERLLAVAEDLERGRIHKDIF